MRIIADTEVQPAQVGRAYDRSWIVREWDPDDEFRAAFVTIRVDATPARSQAKVELWVADKGWQAVYFLPAREYWYDMPGWSRWRDDNTDRLTRRLMERLIDSAVEELEKTDVFD